MSEGTKSEVTRLLGRVREGHPSAAEHLMPLVYDKLRSLARSFFTVQRPDHTLEPTALVHEAFLRLVDQKDIEWQSRAHFFAVAAKAMRQILINHAEAKATQKRGGGWQRITLDGAAAEEKAIDLLALNDALGRLELLDERHARIVELRFFGGLTVEETAEVLRVAPRTVELDWRMAKRWLLQELAH